MKKLSKLMLATFVATLFLSACQPKEQKVYIVTTNDMHANIDNFPKLAALIDSLRTVHPDLILMSAGDNRSGNPINDRYEQPTKPMYELMNTVGFDLSCFGNHEWDRDVTGLRDVLTWANFPFVCANVTFDDSLQMPNFKPYNIIERDGLKLGVIGGIQLGLNGLPDSHPKNLGGCHFTPITEVLPQYIDSLKDCNAIFLLSHCGYEEDRETAAKFPQLAAIFGGHTHRCGDLPHGIVKVGVNVHAVADHADDIIFFMVQISARRHTDHGGNGCGTVPRPERIVDTFRTLRKSRKSAFLTQTGEAAFASRQKLVRVALMPDVPNQFVFGGIKHIMQSDRQFDDAQTGTQMTAGRRNDLYDFLTDLVCQKRQIADRQRLQIRRRSNRIQ